MPLARIQVVGLKELKAEMDDIRANQLPFATAKSLTKTAGDAQDVVRREILPARFTLRSPAFIKAGVRIAPATKTKLEAAVQDIDKFMDLQETGGVKIPYGSAIAVPLSGARPTLRSVIAKENYPHEVMARGGFIRGNVMYAVAFKQGRRGRVAKGIFGIQRAATWERKIVPMYVLVKRAAIKPRYGFEASVLATVQKNFQTNFNTAFAQAVRTAKK
jgi:hypothetical protein